MVNEGMPQRVKLTCKHIARGRREAGTGPSDARSSAATICGMSASVQRSCGNARVSATAEDGQLQQKGDRTAHIPRRREVRGEQK